ncbi:MAG: VWA domain-containing protein [Kiritimatiellaeota bacterium]|nr:VWA domain-containing protein [Kiritimatiellota bacterium]
MPVFLAPWFLAAGLAAAIPVAIHLLHRRKPKPLPFSTLRFIREAVDRTRRSRNLTHILALLMRVLILLLLACAFARPKVRFASWLPEGRRTLVVVLDDSASMQFQDGEKTNFEKARDWVRQLLGSLAESDRVALVLAGAPDPWVVFPPISDHPVVLRALDDVKPGYGRARLVQVLSEVASRLGETGDTAGVELHVFSDFQESDWNATEAESLAPELGRRRLVLFLNHVRPMVAANAGIVDTAFYPPAVLGSGTFTANVRVHSSPDYRGPNSLRLFVGDKEQARTTFTLRPAQTVTESVSGTVAGEAPGLTGRLELETDSLAPDNTFYFSLPRFPGIPVLLADGNARGPGAGNGTQDTLFLRYAIQPRGRTTTLFLPRIVDWATFVSSDPRRFPVVFVCNPPSLDRTVAAKLTEFVRSGGTAVLFPGNLGALENQLGQLEPLRGLKVQKTVLDEETSISLVRGERPSEIEKRLRAFLPGNPTFVLRRRLLFRGLPAKAAVVFQYTDSSPFLFEVPFGKGRLWVCSVSADRDWSDWPLTPFFVICQQELIKNSAQRNLPVLMGRVGRPFALIWNENATDLDFRLTSPGGRARMVSVTRKTPDRPVVLGGFYEPGLYRLERRGRVTTVAVNLPPEESKLTSVGRQDLAFTLRAVPVYQSSDWHEQQQQLVNLHLGRPLWPLLLALAFFLAVTEELFANLRSRAAALPEALRQFLRRGGRAA